LSSAADVALPQRFGNAKEMPLVRTLADGEAAPGTPKQAAHAGGAPKQRGTQAGDGRAGTERAAGGRDLTLQLLQMELCGERADVVHWRLRWGFDGG
jgi:hypothetical protein